MTYTQGQTVIYPHHGACVVERVELKELLGEERSYLVLRALAGGLTVSVPEATAEDLGVRLPISGDELDDLAELLRRTDVRVPTNWSRRLKNHQEKLKSGDVYQVAEVVRNLTVFGRGKDLSIAEREMLAHAKANLVNELAASFDNSTDAASTYLEDVLEPDTALAS